jgi:hypothetical protein
MSLENLSSMLAEAKERTLKDDERWKKAFDDYENIIQNLLNKLPAKNKRLVIEKLDKLEKEPNEKTKIIEFENIIQNIKDILGH